MGVTSAETQEMAILRQRLTDAEVERGRAKQVIARQAAAIMNVDLKVYHCMKQLLTANDVYRDSVGHDPMRINILEILNDLRRYAQHEFERAGIITEGAPDASHRLDLRGRPGAPESPSDHRTLQ